ncbi:MAG: hypothetical protein R6V50_01385 [Thermoplasmatota archaeon]
MPEYRMIIVSSFDDYKSLDNYHLFNDKILPDSIINFSLSFDFNLSISATHRRKITAIKFKINTLCRDREIFHEVGNKYSKKELSQLILLHNGLLNYKKMAIPSILCLQKSKNLEVAVVMPFALKESIMTPCLIDEGELSLITVSRNNSVHDI